MREIKFKALAAVSKQEMDNLGIKHVNGWLYGALLDKFIVGVVTAYTNIGLAIEQWCEIIPGTVGQYTGLKDKNGREIYEGDIIQYKTIYEGDKSPTKKAVVIFENGEFKVPGVVLDLSLSTILGNIHENPELLKEG